MTDREKLIELLEPWLAHLSLCAANDLIANGVNFAADTNNGGKWISVEDRLPDELPKDGNDWAEMMRPSVDVLVKLKGSEELRTAWYSYSRKIWVDVASGRYMGNLVTHWMPLPEPPKEE